MQIKKLREYQVDFEKTRISFHSEHKELFKLRDRFIKDYTTKMISSLNLDDYVAGKGFVIFCNRIENELNDWGNIHGSFAKKFGIYYGVDGIDKVKKYRIGKVEFGTSIGIAFEKVKFFIVELIENENNFDILKKNLISPMFKGKILSIYHLDKFLNIFFATYLDYFINELGLENNSKSELDKQKRLLEFKNSDLIMKTWSIFEFNKFLYHSFGKPNNELKDNAFSKELKIFKLKDFPPIENVKSEFVNLKMDELSESNNITNRISKKTDYFAQSRKLKRIGDWGEQIVVMAERQILIEKGRKSLAEKVDYISKRDDSIGYDI